MSVSISALLHELARHERQGRPAEVERCKRELAKLGHKFAAPLERAVERKPRETRKA